MTRIDAYRLAEQITDLAQAEGISLGFKKVIPPTITVYSDHVGISFSLDFPKEPDNVPPSQSPS